ncbi:hypothetical protein ACLB2K_048740 [Fragaria x ananassa]
MASLPDQNGDSGPSGGCGRESQRTIPTPFLTKTYEFVDDPEADELISWSEGGSTFVVWRPAEFARDILPKDSGSVVPDRWEFSNDCFKRGEKGLLREIQRRKISPSVSASAATMAAAAAVTAAMLPVAAVSVSPANSGDEHVISSNSSPVTLLQRARSCNSTAEILEENERLRKENMQLSNELTQLRGLCNSIFAMMTNYASGQLARGGGAVADDKPPPPPPHSVKISHRVENGGDMAGKSAEEDEMEEDQEEETPLPLALPLRPIPTAKLFGVSLGVKRLRRDEEGEGEDQERQNQGCD